MAVPPISMSKCVTCELISIAVTKSVIGMAQMGSCNESITADSEIIAISKLQCPEKVSALMYSYVVFLENSDSHQQIHLHWFENDDSSTLRHNLNRSVPCSFSSEEVFHYRKRNSPRSERPNNYWQADTRRYWVISVSALSGEMVTTYLSPLIGVVLEAV